MRGGTVGGGGIVPLTGTLRHLSAAGVLRRLARGNFRGRAHRWGRQFCPDLAYYDSDVHRHPGHAGGPGFHRGLKRLPVAVRRHQLKVQAGHFGGSLPSAGGHGRSRFGTSVLRLYDCVHPLGHSFLRPGQVLRRGIGGIGIESMRAARLGVPGAHEPTLSLV